MPKLNITQASVVSLFTTVVGFVVAYVPSFTHSESTIIAIGTVVIASIFSIVHALPFHQAAAKSVNAEVPYKIVTVPQQQALPQGGPHGQ